MRLQLIVFGLVSFISSACSQEHTLTILHTNDVHASFLPHEAVWIKSSPKPMVGGFNELVYAVDSIRATNSSAILLDAGDVMTGNPISDIEYGGAEGGALFEMMNRVGYDAACPGNHDLDISQANLRALINVQRFPALSANLVNDDGKLPFGNEEYTILDRGGLRIGVFGLMYQGLASVVNQNNLVGVKVLSPVETAQRIVRDLDPKTDIIIAVTHQGVRDDSIVAANVEGLDIIVGGHTHTRLQQPKVINGVVIVQAGANCENLGVLEVKVSNDAVTSHSGKLVQLWTRNGRITRLSPFIDSLKSRIDTEYAEVIATLKEDWRRGGGEGETNIGNFVVNAMAEAASAEIGFTNSHGIRKDMAAGKVTKRDIYEILPFRNVLVTFQLSGKQLKDVMAYYFKRKPAIQISAVRCSWKKSGEEIEIVSLTVDGKPVDENKIYICATSDFFAGQSIQYIGMEIERPVFSSKTLFDVAVDAARKAGEISTSVEGRFREVQ